MKKNFTIAFVLFVLIGLHPASAQTPITHRRDVSVTTQAEVDALRTSLTAGATRIMGNVTIGPESTRSDISDLSPLAAITEITGNVVVQGNPRLPNLMGLNQLQSIGGSFSVHSNRTLTSLGDFPALQSIGGSFVVESNRTLISLGDFSALQSIGGDFSVFSSNALTSLGNFSALQSIEGRFQVIDNGVLTSLGDFTVLQSIGGYFGVRDNDALTSLGGFPMLTSIGNSDGIIVFNTGTDEDNVSILIQRNDLLQDCCVLTAFLSGATNAVSGQVFISDNASGCSSTTQVNCDPSLQVGQKVVLAAKTVAEGTLDIFSTLRWQLSKPNTGAEWITNMAAGGGNSDASSVTGENYAFITITTAANPNDAGRNTTLTLRAIDVAGNALTDPAPVTILFTQLGTTHTGDITLASQAEVNAIVLPANATAIQGNLIIGGIDSNSDITDLRPLSGITHVTGHVEVEYNARLVSLGSLGNLQTIGGSFSVFGNNLLQDCCVLTEFLSGATSGVSGQIFIGNNAPGCSSTTEVNCDDFLQVGQKVVFIAKTATEGTLEIFSRGRWQLNKPGTGADWITDIAASGGNNDASSITGENDASIAITTTVNPNNARRSTTLTLTTIDMADNALTDPAPITIPFTQLGIARMGDVFVTTQAEVNALTFPANAMAIQGNVTIGPSSGTSDITDLSPLAAITEITGNVVVQRNPDLLNLVGLNQLQTIGGFFDVFSNASLTSLGDFSTLQSIGDYFYVSNEDLISLGDFSTLQSIGGFFDVRNNADLTSLGGFTALQSIGSSFSVSSTALTSLGDFPVLQSIGSFFQVFSNDDLTSLGDFSALQSIGGVFQVFSNDELTSLGNFASLQSIGDYFRVSSNDELTSLGAFPMLASIGIADEVFVPSIGSSQDGVSIVVENNDRLQDCCVLTEFLSGATSAVSGQIFIGNNASGCNSTMQVNCDPFLQVGQKVVFIAKTATEGTLEIFSTLRWQLSKPDTGADWITNIAASGDNNDASSITGENHAFIIITTTANPSNAGRSTALTLRAIDMAGNALTDPAPITISFTHLGTTHIGDVFVRTQAEVDALRTSLTAGATHIMGNVTIGSTFRTSDITNLSPLAAITEITGNVVFQDNTDLTNLMGLNQLQTIGGSFEVNGNHSLTSLGDFPALQSIGGSFEVSSNAILTSLGDFSTLQSIGGSFVLGGGDFSGNHTLASLGDFPALQSIGDSFRVRNNDALTSLGDFSTLQSIGDSFEVENNNNLTSLGDFSILQSIGDSFVVGGRQPGNGNHSLTSLGDFPALQTIGGSFVLGGGDFSGNRTLASMGDFPTLQSIGGSFEVKGNATLTSLGNFSTLQSIGESFGVSSNATLTSLGNFSTLQSIGESFGVYDNIALTSLGDFSTLQSIGESFGVSSNATLTSLGNFSTLQSIGESFGVYDNVALTSLGDFPALRSISGGFRVSSNSTLTSLGNFPALQSIGGSFEVGRDFSGNRTLTSLGNFTALLSIGGYFGVRDNDALTSLGGFPMLASIGNARVYVSSIGRRDNVSIVVRENGQLQDCCVLTEFLSGAANAVSSQVFINDNATGCSSTTEVNCDPFLQIDQKVVFIAKTATESTLNLFSTLRWQLSKPNTGAEWITNIAVDGGNSDASSITGENYAFITITTTANPNDAGRSTTLTLKAIDMAGNALTDLTPIAIPFTQVGITRIGDVTLQSQADVNAFVLPANATSIQGNVTIGPEFGTSDIFDISPLIAITEITGNVVVRRNPDLPNLMGLNQLQAIGGYFEVLSNASLTSLGDFSALQSIGRFFNVRNNEALTSLGDFSALQSIGGGFGVRNNEALTSLGDFSALQSIGSFFNVRDNDELTSLGDFSTLQTIGSFFQVFSNDELTSLGGFPMLVSIGSDQDDVSISVRENDRLQDCCVLTEFLSGATNAVSGQISINNNATGCNSITEVNCDPFLKVDKKVVFVAKTATEGTLEIFSTLRWQLSKPNTGAEWITNMAAGGGNSDASSITGENYAFITITTATNPNNVDRSTTLTLTAIDVAGNALTNPDPVTILFTQTPTTYTRNVFLDTQA